MDNDSSEKKPFFTRLSDIEKKNVDWLWNQRIPKKCVTLIEGDGGIGKSFVIAAIIADLTQGRPLPGDIAKDPINVLLLALEDDPEVVLKTRYEALNADCEKVHILDKAFTLNKERLTFLESEIINKNAKLVVIDPVVAYFTINSDTNKATDVRAFMNGLNEIAKRNNIAVVAIRHWNKNSQATAAQRGSGSVDFRNASRSVLQVLKNGEERYLALEKTNYSARAKTISFSINDGILRWGQESDKTADDILAEIYQNREIDDTPKDEAKDWLAQKLQNGQLLSKIIEEEAQQYGISNRTLHRAKRELGAVSIKLENKWYWSLSTLPNNEDCQP